MILTTDALVGGTLSLALIASTMPLTMNTAKKAAETRRDLVAEHVAAACNVAMFRDETLKSKDLKNLLTGKVSAAGECGSPRDVLTLTWSSGSERTIEFDRKTETFVVG